MKENNKSFYPLDMFEFVHHLEYRCCDLKGLMFISKWSHWRWHQAESWEEATMKNSKNPRFYGSQNRLLFWHLALQPLGSFSHVTACRNSSKNTKKNWTYNLFWTKIHHGLIWRQNLTCFDVAGKLVKYVVRSFFFGLNVLKPQAIIQLAHVYTKLALLKLVMTLQW
jgi:hypothetical protein